MFYYKNQGNKHHFCTCLIAHQHHFPKNIGDGSVLVRGTSAASYFLGVIEGTFGFEIYGIIYKGHAL